MVLLVAMLLKFCRMVVPPAAIMLADEESPQCTAGKLGINRGSSKGQVVSIESCSSFSRSVSSVFISGQVWFFPITAIFRGGVFVAHLVTLSPPPPPLVELLLQTKAKVQFERPVIGLSKPLFRLLLASNRVDFFRPILNAIVTD
jgi:hypothetical protein